MPQTKGASHGPCCDRSGREEIANLRAERRRRDRRGETLGYVGPQALPGGTTEESGDRGDVRGGIRRGGGSEGAGSRHADCSGDVGANARRGSSTHEDGPARCPGAERGFVPRRPAVGPHPEGGVAGEEDLLRNAGFTSWSADEGDQYGARLASRPRPSAWERKQSY